MSSRLVYGPDGPMTIQLPFDVEEKQTEGQSLIEEMRLRPIGNAYITRFYPKFQNEKANPLFLLWQAYVVRYRYDGTTSAASTDDYEFNWLRLILNTFAYAIPYKGALAAMAIIAKKFCNGQIIEIGAGTGYWAHLGAGTPDWG